MGVAPAELVRLAQHLADRPDEVSHRASASRAYYFAFHTCSTVVAGLGRTPDYAGPAHAALINRLKEFSLRENQDVELKARSLGWMLAQLRDVRTTADYHLDVRFDHVDAVAAIAQAKAIEARALEIAGLI